MEMSKCFANGLASVFIRIVVRFLQYPCWIVILQDQNGSTRRRCEQQATPCMTGRTKQTKQCAFAQDTEENLQSLVPCCRGSEPCGEVRKKHCSRLCMKPLCFSSAQLACASSARDVFCCRLPCCAATPWRKKAREEKGGDVHPASVLLALACPLSCLLSGFVQ